MQINRRVACLAAALLLTSFGAAAQNAKMVVGDELRPLVNNEWNKARALCETGYLAVGGTCEGNPVGVVHPMTGFEADPKDKGRTAFFCNFYISGHDGSLTRSIRATAGCVKLK